MNPGDDTKLRPEEAAKRLGIPKNLLAKMRTTGEGPPFFKIGGSVIYTKTDVDVWLASKRATRTTSNNRGRPSRKRSGQEAHQPSAGA